MTQKEKELLLKDLCARLLYGTKVCYRISDKDKYITETLSGHMLDYFNENSIIEVKPYLRPISDMTEKEKVIYHKKNQTGRLHALQVPIEHHLYRTQECIDWMNKKHFDYRGLIKKGLAIPIFKNIHKKL